MLKTSVLICPGPRAEVPLLAAEAPLAVVSALGESLVEYWISHMACAGVKEVMLLANDRPDEVRKIVGNGSRWGVAAEVVAEATELTLQQAAQKYQASVSVMDHFPGLSRHPLFTNYGHWFKALLAWMPRARTPDRVGIRECHAGVWKGIHSHVSREARLIAPCWVGDHVYVGPGAVIGPGAILENGAFIEAEAQISGSVVGPATLVGRYMQITSSLTSGNTLVNWQSGEETKVPEPFLLCSLHPRQSSARTVPLLDRLAELVDFWTDDEPLEPQPVLIKRGS